MVTGAVGCDFSNTATDDNDGASDDIQKRNFHEQNSSETNICFVYFVFDCWCGAERCGAESCGVSATIKV